MVNPCYNYTRTHVRTYTNEMGALSVLQEKLEGNVEYRRIGKMIVALERDLMATAPDNIKKLYLQIDFLRCKQEGVAIEALIKS